MLRIRCQIFSWEVREGRFVFLEGGSQKGGFGRTPQTSLVTGLLQQAICLHPSDAPVLVNVSVDLEPSQSVGLQENTLMNSSFELPSYTTFRSVVVSTLSKLQGVGLMTYPNA